MKISEQFDVKCGVHTLQLLDENRLGVIGEDNSYRVYDLNEFKLLDGFKGKFDSNTLYINNMAISSDAKHLSFYNNESKDIHLFDTASRNFTHVISAHVGGVETVEFTKDNKYLISGGMEGRIYMWSVENGKKVDTLLHHYDSISAIASYDNSTWIATAGYDKVIKVFNRSFRQNNYKLISHQEPITCVKFISSQRLLSADKEGTILLWDIVESKVITRLPKFDSHITAIALDKEEQFLFVAGLGGYVGLYNLAEKKLLKVDFLKQLAGITQMQYCDKEKMLLFGLSNGHIPIYLFKKEEQEFTALMQSKDFDGCYNLTKANPLLLYSKLYERLENLFEKSFEHAKKLLRLQKKDEAKEIMKFFTATSAKRLIVQKLFHDFALFDTFAKAVRGKKYLMAYALAEEYSTLKETPEYLKMEDEWSKILLVVRRIINEKASEEKIKQLFRPFMGIPGKNLIIKSLYTNRNVFILFQKHLKEQDFFSTFKLATAFPFIQELDEYALLLKMGETLKENTQDTFNSGDYYDAVKLCDTLVLFPPQKEYAAALRTKANIYAETMQYFADKKYGAVYSMIAEHPYLSDTQIIVDLEKGFIQLYEKAEVFASDADVESVKKTMHKFSKIRAKIPSIVHLIKIAYWTQIERASLLNSNDKELQEAFKKYQNYFGFESVLQDILQSINQSRVLKIDFDTKNTKTFMGALDRLEENII